MKILGILCCGIGDAEYDTTPRVRQLADRGVVAWMARYIFVQNRNGNLHVPYLIENGDEVVMNWNWLDNDWNDNNPAARFAILFISLPPIRCLGEFSFSIAPANRQASGPSRRF